MEINMSLQPIEIIEQILGAYAEDGSAMRCDEIHAYLTAFVSGPDGIADDADAVIDAVIGDAAIDAAQRERIKEIVLQWAEELRQNLKDKQLPELPLYEDENGEPDYFSWCNAYLYALDNTPTDWFAASADEEFEDLFYPIMALGGIYDEDDILSNLSRQEINGLQNEVPYAVRDIFAYWQAVINKPQTIRREGEKIGRNDPCPCESGKKYKACCGK